MFEFLERVFSRKPTPHNDVIRRALGECFTTENDGYYCHLLWVREIPDLDSLAAWMEANLSTAQLTDAFLLVSVFRGFLAVKTTDLFFFGTHIITNVKPENMNETICTFCKGLALSFSAEYFSITLSLTGEGGK